MRHAIQCIAAFLILLAAGSIAAGDVGSFATTSEEIVQGLLHSGASAAKRNSAGQWDTVVDGSRTRTLTRGLPSGNPEPVKTRAIKSARKNAGRVVYEKVVIPEKRRAHVANLKVMFDVNSYNLRSGAYALLDELGRALTDPRLSGYRYQINGHTDSDGSHAYNLDLSLNRALAVTHYLMANFRIPAYRLTVRGYGEGMPLVANTSPKNKQLNRRVEIVAEN